MLFMKNPQDIHPLAPKPVSPEEGFGQTDNSRTSVKLRSGIELGTMRFVLGFGILFAVVAMLVGWFLGYFAPG